MSNLVFVTGVKSSSRLTSQKRLKTEIALIFLFTAVFLCCAVSFIVLFLSLLFLLLVPMLQGSNLVFLFLFLGGCLMRGRGEIR